MERLKKTKESAQNQVPASKPTTSTSTVNTSPGTSTKPTSIFYGNDTHQKANALDQYENKMKQQQYHGQTNRIISQPYPKRDANATSSSTTTNNNSAQIFLKPFEKPVTCTCSMISSTRFQVTTSGYSDRLINEFKTISTRSYSKSNCYLIYFVHLFNQTQFIPDYEKRIWSFDLSAYEEVQKKVGALKPHVVIGPIPQFVLKLLKQGILVEMNANDYSKFENSVNFKLFSLMFGGFQRRMNLISCFSMRLKRKSAHNCLVSKSMVLPLQSATADVA